MPGISTPSRKRPRKYKAAPEGLLLFLLVLSVLITLASVIMVRFPVVDALDPITELQAKQIH